MTDLIQVNFTETDLDCDHRVRDAIGIRVDDDGVELAIARSVGHWNCEVGNAVTGGINS